MDLGRFVGTPTAVSCSSQDGTLGTHARLTGTSGSPKLPHVRRIVRRQNRQTALTATRRAIGLRHPLGRERTVSMALHSQTSLPLLHFGGARPCTTSCRSAPGVGGRGGFCWPVAPAGPLAFHGKSIGGVRPSLAPSGTARRSAGRASQQRHGPGCGPGGRPPLAPGGRSTLRWRCCRGGVSQGGGPGRYGLARAQASRWPERPRTVAYRWPGCGSWMSSSAKGATVSWRRRDPRRAAASRRRWA